MYWYNSYNIDITWKGRNYEWPSVEPAEKAEYEQYVWDLAASFKNAAPFRLGARQHVLLPAPARGRAQPPAGRRLHPDGGRPAGVLPTSGVHRRGPRGLRYLANITAMLGHRLTRMAALARPHQAKR
ncbi:hypothetical protein V2W45_1340231 [Cenococcum geophilum]